MFREHAQNSKDNLKFQMSHHEFIFTNAADILESRKKKISAWCFDVTSQCSMVYQLYALCEAGIANVADVRLLSFVTQHMLFQNDRLSEAAIAKIAFVWPNVVVNPEMIAK